MRPPMFHLRFVGSLFRFAWNAPQFEPSLRLPNRCTTRRTVGAPLRVPHVFQRDDEGACAPSLRSPLTALGSRLRAAERG